MKFSIGDRIILKQTGEEGHVTAYINQDMFEVEVNGVSFPVYKDDIDHPYLKWFTENKKKKTVQSIPDVLPLEKQQFRKPKLAKGVYLSFMPEYKPDVFEDEVSFIKIYLLNELPSAVYFQYQVVDRNQQTVFKHEGKLHGFGHLYLHALPFEEMSEQPRFRWELTDADDAANAVATDTLKIRPQKLFEHINTLLQSNEPTFSYLLVDTFLPKPKEEKPDKFVPPVKQNVAKPAKDWRASLPRFEIDLHIENLMPDTKGMSNADMLQIQLKALNSHLQAVISNRQERTIIIHGLGKGVLRDEVHKVLRQIPEVSKFSNEWQGQYGFGATEVWFRY
jgi:hypothetical protein